MSSDINAERAGSVPAEEYGLADGSTTRLSAAFAVVPMYGPRGWRSRNADRFPFVSDAALRWVVDEHRQHFLNCGAVVMLTGRVCAVLPKFEAALLEVGSLTWGGRLRALDQREKVLAHAVDGLECDDADRQTVHALRSELRVT